MLDSDVQLVISMIVSLWHGISRRDRVWGGGAEGKLQVINIVILQ